MQLLCVHVYLVLLSILEHVNVVGAAPCQQTTSIMRSYQNTICTSRFWGTCTHHAFVWRYYVEYRKICCVGYGGPNCQPVCSSGCNGRGTCVALEQCSCDNSYTGNACQTPVCSLSCGHGTCIQPNTCSCHYGYTGRLCNTPVCRLPCQNRGICISPDTCSCAETYTGQLCETLVYDKSEH
nr:wnt inhibitory factor 1-like isoform X2 [Crassostrea gigas]